ncbi:hypothetical protein DSO57_1023802 [Entomophthora muscae]|uniref:Uncharacterized protein n=1 Tax=Entomophthora muscae TaxID=34485 RepID=A0ACC2TDZ4_9FUNG|nr:hypothetical protein DSO57_1023802 [Entomophthora muscae]
MAYKVRWKPVKTLWALTIWVSERMVQPWMYGKVASVRVLTNVAGNQWDGAEDSPYDPTIEFNLVKCLKSLSDDAMFISYYKPSIAFDDFGKQGRATTQKERKKIKKGNFHCHILGGLLNSWDGSNSKHWVFLSHQMEGSSTALEAIQQRGHQALV